MFKYAFFILIALFIDGFQLLIDLGLMAIGAAAGTIGGAAAGAAACSPAGETVAAVCAAVGGFVGWYATPALAPVLTPLFMIVGFTIGAIISMTIGSGLVFLLTIYGMFYPRYAIPAFIGEVLPGFDILPAWTAMVVASILKKEKISAAEVVGFTAKAGSKIGGSDNPVSQGVQKGNAAGSPFAPERVSRLQNNGQSEQKQVRQPLILQSPKVDGISRPTSNAAANDNNSARETKFAA
ncbi:MAG: hypothetical protein JWO43_318 [Candidatus Adlerbacteria bacterium]|nr:hypothetical protein [Candidatus Adlerbacteria bacterium]